MTTDDKASAMQIEEIARYPLPGMPIPGGLALSPNDKLITYLFSPDQSLTRELYAFDPTAGEQQPLIVPEGGGTTEENVSLEEALRRERQRLLELGVTQYAWAEDRNRILVPLQGSIYVQDGAGTPLRKIVDRGGTPTLDAH